MRLTIVGGGGFRVPLVFRALCEDPDLGVDELVLHDVDRGRLAAISRVLEHLAATAGRRAPRVRATTDLVEAVGGTDVVFSAIRVGGLAGRVLDERTALAHGVVGQETTGAGGVCFGLRTVPVVRQLAAVVAEQAPKAWVVNFTNPAGMVTEAMRARLGDRVIGICDSPVALFRRVGEVLGVARSEVEFDYAGLNHLGWLRRALVDGVDRLPELLADDRRLLAIEEGRLFGPSWLRSLGTLPNEYLWYWYFRSDAVAAGRRAEQTRGEIVSTQQSAFYRSGGVAGAGEAYAQWERTRHRREASYLAEVREASGAGERKQADLHGGGYDQVALAVMRAVTTDRPATLVLNVANRGALPFLDDDAVVEVPCRVDAAGARPLPVGRLDLHAQGLVTDVKAVERVTIEAAATGSAELAVQALALHPLVGSVPTARAILADQLEAVPELARVIDPRGAATPPGR